MQYCNHRQVPYDFLEFCFNHNIQKIPKEMLYIAYQEEKKRGFPSGKTLLIMKNSHIFFHIIKDGYIPIKTSKQIILIDESILMADLDPAARRQWYALIQQNQMVTDVLEGVLESTIIQMHPSIFKTVRDLSMDGRFRVVVNFFGTIKNAMYKYINNTIKHVNVEYQDGDLTIVPVHTVDHFYDYS